MHNTLSCSPIALAAVPFLWRGCSVDPAIAVGWSTTSTTWLAATVPNKRLHLQLIKTLVAVSMALVETPHLLHQALHYGAAAVAEQQCCSPAA
jgi:hypothetical protein